MIFCMNYFKNYSRVLDAYKHYENEKWISFLPGWSLSGVFLRVLWADCPGGTSRASLEQQGVDRRFVEKKKYVGGSL